MIMKMIFIITESVRVRATGSVVEQGELLIETSVGERRRWKGLSARGADRCGPAKGPSQTPPRESRCHNHKKQRERGNEKAGVAPSGRGAHLASVTLNQRRFNARSTLSGSDSLMNFMTKFRR
jgi:hypothetical protein